MVVIRAVGRLSLVAHMTMVCLVLAAYNVDTTVVEYQCYVRIQLILNCGVVGYTVLIVAITAEHVRVNAATAYHVLTHL